jgi:hypothetical protein
VTGLPISIAQLQGMIGLHILWHDTRYAIVEVLEDGPALVAQRLAPDAIIQGDAHGRAHRQVQPVITICVLTPDRSLLHNDFLDIELC